MPGKAVRNNAPTNMSLKAVHKKALSKKEGWKINLKAKCRAAEAYMSFSEFWKADSGLEEKYWLHILEEVKAVWVGDTSELTVWHVRREIPEVRRNLR